MSTSNIAKSDTKSIAVKENNNDNKEGSKTNRTGDGKDKFTFKQKLALFSLTAADFTSYCSMSIMAPFYPKEAMHKGMSSTISGLVFSFYALVIFLSSPVFGKLLPKLGVRFIYVSGLFVCGLCCIIFGALIYVEDLATFTVLSFVLRGIEALGASAYTTASFVFISHLFPNNAGTVRGILEVFSSLGMSVGPAVGGFLFAIGGFELPFYVLGIVTVISAPMNLLVLPLVEKPKVEGNSNLLGLLKIPSVAITSCILIVVSITWNFLDPTLEPHLRQFNLSPTNVGLIFLLFSILFASSCPGWGWLSDKYGCNWFLMSCGLIFNAFNLMFLGPSPILFFIDNSLNIILVAVSSLGVSVALTLIPTYQAILDGTIEGGRQDNLTTQSIVAGVWASIYSLGGALGPFLGGTILEYHGFPITATVIAAINIVTVIVVAIYLYVRKKSKTLELMCVDSSNKKCYSCNKMGSKHMERCSNDITSRDSSTTSIKVINIAD